MVSAWHLPEHISDVLPAQARHLEELRRTLLDVARSYGCELVVPPLLENIESLLSGAGQALGLRTFKLVDQLGGRTLGVRADSTPQVARIDAHLLNRQGVTRLCYCGPVLHTLPQGTSSNREPLQFGAEIYGHSGLEADLEAQDLALDCLSAAGIERATLDLGDARVLRGLLGGIEHGQAFDQDLHDALAAKDCAALRGLVRHLPQAIQTALLALPDLYGDAKDLESARRALPALAPITSALDDLVDLARHAQTAHPGWDVSFDLADMGGLGYYSGARFAVYVNGFSDAIARGGRYDEIGSAFGRNRPAVGFSLDLKALAPRVPPSSPRSAVRAPWGQDPGLRLAIRSLRQSGESVLCAPAAQADESVEFLCDRQLVSVDGRWVVRSLPRTVA